MYLRSGPKRSDDHILYEIESFGKNKNRKQEKLFLATVLMVCASKALKLDKTSLLRAEGGNV